MRRTIRSLVLAASLAMLAAPAAAYAEPAQSEIPPTGCQQTDINKSVSTDKTSATVQVTLRCTLLGVVVANATAQVKATGQNCQMPEVTIVPDQPPGTTLIRNKFDCTVDASAKTTNDMSIDALGKAKLRLSTSSRAHEGVERLASVKASLSPQRLAKQDDGPTFSASSNGDASEVDLD